MNKEKKKRERARASEHFTVWNSESHTMESVLLFKGHI